MRESHSSKKNVGRFPRGPCHLGSTLPSPTAILAVALCISALIHNDTAAAVPAEFDAIVREAELLTKNGQYSRAVDAWQAALDRASRARTDADTVYLRFRLAETERLFGRPRRSLQILRPLLEQSAREGTRAIRMASSIELWPGHLAGRAALLHAAGAASYELGDFEEASRNYDDALALLTESDSASRLSRSVILRSMADLERLRGEYAKASELLRQSFAIRERLLGRDAPELAPLHRSFGQLQIEQWDLARAEVSLNRALRLDEAAFGSNHPDVAADLEALAILDWRRGRYSAARAWFHRCRAAQAASLPPTHPTIAWTLVNEADLLLDMGLSDKAANLDLQAIHILEESLGPQHPDLAVVRYNLARARAEGGKISEAIRDIDDATARFRRMRGPDHEWTLEADEELGRLLGNRNAPGDVERAVTLLKQVLAKREAKMGTDHIRLVKTLRILSRLQRLSGRSNDAVKTADRAVSLSRTLLGRFHPETGRTLWERALGRAEVGGITDSMRDFDEYVTITTAAFGGLDGEEGGRFDEFRRNIEDWNRRVRKSLVVDTSMRQQLLDAAMKAEDCLRGAQMRAAQLATLPPERKAAYDAIELHRRRAEMMEAELAASRRERSLDPELEWRLTSRVREIWLDYAQERGDRLKARDPELWRILNISPSAGRALQQWLRPGEIYLRIATAESGTVVYLVASDREDFHDAASLSSGVLRERVLRLRELVTRRDADMTPLVRECKRFFVELFGPRLGPIVAQADTVHIVPGGPLFYLPFEILDPGSTSEYRPWLLTAAIDYIANPATSFAARPGIASGTLIYANPAPIPDGLESLAGAEVEARLIHEKDSAAVVRTLTDAREGAFKRDLFRLHPDLLLISAHARAVPLTHDLDAETISREGTRQAFLMEQTAVLLAPDMTPGGDDGRLTLSEVRRLQVFPAPRLIALSGCQTAVGDVSSGDEVMHLAEGFREMGAEHVVATLWSVEDEASCRLVYRFYLHLRDGRGVPEALRLAKVDLWNDARGRFRQPIYWAGYIAFRPRF